MGIGLKRTARTFGSPRAGAGEAVVKTVRARSAMSEVRAAETEVLMLAKEDDRSRTKTQLRFGG